MRSTATLVAPFVSLDTTSNVRFPESCRSRAASQRLLLWPLVAESSRPLTSVNGSFGLNSGRTDDIFRR